MLKTKDLAICALSAACIAVCSWISIPASVPFTLQTFAVFLICGVFGAKRGCISILVYLLLGAFGLPVFAGFRGGFSVLFGTTGGYIFGFLLSALWLWGTQRFWEERPVRFFLFCLAALLLCYACGTLWFYCLYIQSGETISLFGVLSLCVIPFLVWDLLKIAAAAAVMRRLHHIIR